MEIEKEYIMRIISKYSFYFRRKDGRTSIPVCILRRNQNHSNLKKRGITHFVFPGTIATLLLPFRYKNPKSVCMSPQS